MKRTASNGNEGPALEGKRSHVPRRRPNVRAHDAGSLAKPAFRLLIRPVKHEPDLHYTNKYIKRVEGKLFT